MGGNKPETQRVYYRKWREENREKYLEGKRDYYLRNRESELQKGWARRIFRDFGISVEQYEDMLVEQDGVCAICEQPETSHLRGTLRRLAVDHDPETGRIRGLLCQACNTAIGLLQDDPAILERAKNYLL